MVAPTGTDRVSLPMKRFPIAPAIAAALLALTACSHAAQGPTPITGTSDKFVVQGQFAPIELEQVESLNIEHAKLVVHGQTGSVTLDLPASADATKPDPHWALTTENNIGGQHGLVFTQDQSLDDFSIELPPTDSEMHYGVLSGPDGQDVMLLAWGEQSRCYWGYVTITPKP